MKTSTESFANIFIAGLVFTTSLATTGFQNTNSGSQNAIESFRLDTSTTSPDVYIGASMSSAEESRILVEFVSDIVDNSKPMPAEFAQLVNENFWDLVD